MLYVVFRVGKNNKGYYALVLRTTNRGDILISFDSKLICKLLSITLNQYVDYYDLPNIVIADVEINI